MDSALRPRDIQARIRAGASPQEVADAAGVPVERIDAFAAPVMAERDYISGLARSNPVRRRGETTSHRSLRNAVADALAARGIDADAAAWDAWKLEDRRWQVRIGFDESDAAREGLFVFDALGRFSVAANDEGRALIGDGGTDQLAIVQALQEPDEDEHADDERDPDGPHADAEADEAEAAEHDADDADSDSDDEDDAFHEGDLTEVDGVYDLVPNSQGDLDVLYDMLASFDEDSVKIYAGLVHPKEAAPGTDGPVVVEVVEVEEVVVIEEAPEPAEQTPEPTGEPRPSPAEPEQLSLIDDVEEPAPAPKPRPRRKRASVPSWDEIMFGSPNQPKGD